MIRLWYLVEMVSWHCLLQLIPRQFMPRRWRLWVCGRILDVDERLERLATDDEATPTDGDPQPTGGDPG